MKKEGEGALRWCRSTRLPLLFEKKEPGYGLCPALRRAHVRVKLLHHWSQERDLFVSYKPYL